MGFYTATNIVNRESNNLPSEFRSGAGKAELINLLTDGTLPVFDAIGKTKEQVHNQAVHVAQFMSVAKGLMDDNGITVREEFTQTMDLLKTAINNSALIQGVENMILRKITGQDK